MPQKSRPAQAPVYVNAESLAYALGMSVRHLHKLRQEAWFPPAYQWGARTLRWRLGEVEAALKKHAARARVGAEPAPLAAARERKHAA